MVKTKKLPTYPKPPLCKVYNRQRGISLSSLSAKRLILFLSSHLKPLSIQCLEEPSSSLEGAPVILHFVSLKEIRRLHLLLFSNPSVTDCITTPLRDASCFGEIFVCPAVAAEYRQKKPNISLYEEITLYVLHGYLHLCGYRDDLPKLQKKMRLAEKKWMRMIAEKELFITP